MQVALLTMFAVTKKEPLSVLLWQKLVDNMAAIVAELDRTFVPAIEAAAGPAPEWFKPES